MVSLIHNLCSYLLLHGYPYLRDLRWVIERNSPFQGGWRKQNTRFGVELRRNTLLWNTIEKLISGCFLKCRSSLSINFCQEKGMGRVSCKIQEMSSKQI